MTDPDETANLVGKIAQGYREHVAKRSALPYPHTLNDCDLCRERDADFEAAIADPVTGIRTLLCQQCLGPWSVTQLDVLNGRAVIALEWAPGRLAGHGLTEEDPDYE